MKVRPSLMTWPLVLEKVIKMMIIVVIDSQEVERYVEWAVGQ